MASKRKLIDFDDIFQNGMMPVITGDPWLTIKKLVDRINNAPNIDAVEVAHCKACPNYRAYVNAKVGRGLCTYFMHEMPEDGYCSEHGKGDKDE